MKVKFLKALGLTEGGLSEREVGLLIKKHCTPREGFILVEFYEIGVEGKTLDEIGRVYDVTALRISQVRNRAVRKLKKLPLAHMVGEMRVEAFWAAQPPEMQALHERVKKLEQANFAPVPHRQADDGESLACLGLTTRAENCLRSIGVETVDVLVTKNEEDLLSSQNLGRKSLKEIKTILAERGLHLRN